MTNREIFRDYKSAKNRKEQIHILADLNLMSCGKIVDILIKCCKENEKEITKEEYQDLLFEKLDLIDEEIKKEKKEYQSTLKKLEKKYQDIVKIIKEMR